MASANFAASVGSGKVENVKVKRYFASRKGEDTDDTEGLGGVFLSTVSKGKEENVEEDNREVVTEKKKKDEFVVKEEEREEVFVEDENAVRERRNRARRAREISEEAEEEEEFDFPAAEEEEEEREHVEAEVLSDSEEEESESGSETETESDDEYEDAGRRVMAKAVFVRKSDRITIQEKEQKEADEARLVAAREARAVQRAKESHEMVVKAVTEEEEAERRRVLTLTVDDEMLHPEAVPDDTDEGHEMEEYEKWKLRELLRIKRVKEGRVAAEKERGEVLRRRDLTDEERREEDMEYEQNLEKKEGKGKYKFLQKYYHKGAYFQEEVEKGVSKDRIFMRDYGKAVGDDSFDKSMLPEVLQVKNFGIAGRSKWTHLTNEDTTQYGSNPWTSKEALHGGLTSKRTRRRADELKKPAHEQKRQKR